ncbi:CD-NTase-associated endodeoxyribonuclease Cap4 [Diaphorobacter nitroreducens]|uniref:CD-NTase-associated endodeoxyribonuclease Cap4 n=1 Tax=Diaphorobacter nitroreducens TaxID=164759 RepID=UPI00289ED397|nr:dsDNA nuclease domain-containing protein [Diaphorobacter nitroreducens]
MSSALFDRQATGGVTARNGFDYQDAFLLENIPRLLGQAAFSQAVSELLGDVEIRYFRPGGGTYCVLYEAKRHQLTKAELWEEIAHFQELHKKAPDEYVQFVLLCGDFVGEYQALFNKLDRYRGPAVALNADSSIRATAVTDILDTIVRLGQPAEMARFVLDRVSFVQYSDNNVDAGFGTKLEAHLPCLDMTRQETAAFRARCKQLVDISVKGVVTRKDIEAALVDCAASVAAQWRATPSDLQFAPEGFELGPLAIDVTLFNGPGRGTLGQVAWDQLQQRLVEVGHFLHASRGRRGVQLSAKHRMSLACLLGYCFSATRDFTLVLEHNGQLYDTSLHGRAPGQFFSVQEDPPSMLGLEGVASISFPNGSNADVAANASAFGLENSPKLSLLSSSVVTDIAGLNTAVNEAKVALSEFRGRHQLQGMHLFIKAPAMFAMALGHRLNGVGRIQLYDWDQTKYIPTVQLA